MTSDFSVISGLMVVSTPSKNRPATPRGHSLDLDVARMQNMPISNRFWCCLLQEFTILSVIINVSGLKFSFPTFHEDNRGDLSFSNGSGIANGALQITPNSGNQVNQSGRVLYKEPFKLWKSNESFPTLINTSFVLSIQPLTQPGGEGLAFILTSNPVLPSDSSGQWLGIVDNKTSGSPLSRIIAVEFDTRKSYEEDLDDNHVGIDVNSIMSIMQYSCGGVQINLSSGSDILVNIQYNGVSRLLTVDAFMFNETVQGTFHYSLSHHIDLSLYLLEDVYIGFSGSTSSFTQLNQIKSWNFTMIDIDAGTGGKIRSRLMWLLMILISLPTCAAFIYWRIERRMYRSHKRLEGKDIELLIQENANGPIKFGLKKLKSATGNFDPKRKLGQGGFGAVYRGFLKDMNCDVAVKRLLKDSDRGVQEFIAEVTTISRLSHRNLVKLIGWCHEKNELLLVYEFMPQGSLDKLLFAKGGGSLEIPVLNWERRYKIICGVASALDYLHHGSSKTVLHRDVKAGNVMLDNEFNARLGDFGMARVIEHDGKTHHSTNAIAGTRGFMAPESYLTGRASMQTDVYGFGVFTMEVACGRKPSVYAKCNCGDDSDENGEGCSTYIVDWLWSLHAKGRLLDAVDPRLNGWYDEVQLGCILRLALMCCHPKPKERPSMRMALQVLTGGASPPDPPTEKPAFVWPANSNHCEAEWPYDVAIVDGQLSQSDISGR